MPQRDLRHDLLGKVMRGKVAAPGLGRCGAGGAVGDEGVGSVQEHQRCAAGGVVQAAGAVRVDATVEAHAVGWLGAAGVLEACIGAAVPGCGLLVAARPGSRLGHGQLWL